MLAPGTTDYTQYVVITDDTTGLPKTGITITGIDATYTRNRAAAVKNDLTAHGAVTDAHTDNEAIEISATNAPGLYRIDWPDAAFASGADKVVLSVTCADCIAVHEQIDLLVYAVTVGSGGITSSSFGSGAIDAAAIAANAIGASELAADAAAEIADAVLTEVVTPHAIGNDNVADALSNLSGVATASALTTVGNNVTAILADTAELQTDWANGGRLDLILDARASQTSIDGLNNLSAAGVRTAVGLASANLDTQLSTIDTEVGQALADTGELQTDWADGGRLDLILDGRLATAGYTAPDNASITTIAGVTAKLDDTLEDAGGGNWIFTEAALANAPASEGGDCDPAEIADAVWDEPRSGHTTAGTFGFYLDAAISAVSSGGLTAEDLADAILEAVLGSYDAGTVGGVINAIFGRLSEVDVTVQSVVAGTGPITLIRGDDYAGATAIVLTRDWPGNSLVDGDIAFSVTDASGDAILGPLACSFTGGGTGAEITVSVTLTAAQTQGLSPKSTYQYQVVGTTTGATQHTLWLAPLRVRARAQ